MNLLAELTADELGVLDRRMLAAQCDIVARYGRPGFPITPVMVAGTPGEVLFDDVTIVRRDINAEWFSR
jgi:hypothetical protein